MDSPRRKSVVISIRVPVELAESLEEEAKNRDTTLNALMVNILNKYILYDRQMEKLNYIPLPKRVVEALVAGAGEDLLLRAAYDFGKFILRDEANAWNIGKSFDEVLDFFATRMKYSQVGKVYVYTDQDAYTIVMRHELGLKFSKAWGSFFKGYLDAFYGGIEPSFTYSEEQTTITLTSPEGKN